MASIGERAAILLTFSAAEPLGAGRHEARCKVITARSPSSLSLGGTAGRAYGFAANDAGLGASVVNVGESGAAFGVPRGTVLSVLEILRRADARAVGDVLYGGDRHLRDLALDVFDDINQAGDLG